MKVLRYLIYVWVFASASCSQESEKAKTRTTINSGRLDSLNNLIKKEDYEGLYDDKKNQLIKETISMDSKVVFTWPKSIVLLNKIWNTFYFREEFDTTLYMFDPAESQFTSKSIFRKLDFYHETSNHAIFGYYDPAEILLLNDKGDTVIKSGFKIQQVFQEHIFVTEEEFMAPVARVAVLDTSGEMVQYLNDSCNSFLKIDENRCLMVKWRKGEMELFLKDLRLDGLLTFENPYQLEFFGIVGFFKEQNEVVIESGNRLFLVDMESGSWNQIKGEFLNSIFSGNNIYSLKDVGDVFQVLKLIYR